MGDLKRIETTDSASSAKHRRRCTVRSGKVLNQICHYDTCYILARIRSLGPSPCSTSALLPAVHVLPSEAPLSFSGPLLTTIFPRDFIGTSSKGSYPDLGASKQCAGLRSYKLISLSQDSGRAVSCSTLGIREEFGKGENSPLSIWRRRRRARGSESASKFPLVGHCQCHGAPGVDKTR